MTRKINALTIISDFLQPLDGKAVLDIGCGDGGLSDPLHKAGARWTGVDPYAANGGERAIIRAGAEALPFADASFDAAIYLNALHHVPVDDMAQALQETARVLVPLGRVVIIEPLASGALSTVLAVVDDETEIRAAALASLRQATANGIFRLVATQTYPRRETFADFEDFAARMVAVDQSRAAAITQHRAELEHAFRRHAQQEARGFVLDQPMRADILEKA